MNRSVEIVDQLRTDGWLREYQLNRCERIMRVAIEHRKVCRVFLIWLKPL